MPENSSDSATLFKGRHFDPAIIILCVRCYITYKLSYRDLRDMMAERGIDLAHTTILRWGQPYMPEFEKKWNRYARPVGSSWRVDETYIRVKGEWRYLYTTGISTFQIAFDPLPRWSLKMKAGLLVRNATWSSCSQTLISDGEGRNDK